MHTIAETVKFLKSINDDSYSLLAECLLQEAQIEEVCYLEDFIKLAEAEGRDKIVKTYQRIIIQMDKMR